MSKTKTQGPLSKASTKSSTARKGAQEKALATKAAPKKQANATAKAAPAKKTAAAAQKAAPAKSLAKASKKPASKTPAKKAAKTAKPAASKKAAGSKTAAFASASTSIKKRNDKPAAKTPARKTSVATVSTPTKSVSSRKPAKKATRSRKPKAEVVLPEGYRPTETEPFMSAKQQTYFRNKLVAWKEDIIRQTKQTLEGLTAASEQHADISDRATSETDRALELRARDRQRKLVSKINSALARIEDGSYGYCDESGEPIGLRRLEARPIATLSLEAQERHERRERVFRED